MTQNCLIISVNGDSGSVYTITLSCSADGRAALRCSCPADGRAALRCSCPAGKRRTLCKHLLDLMAGDVTRVTEEVKNLEEFMGVLTTSPLLERTRPLLKRIMEAEKQQKTLKKEVNSLKKDIWRSISAALEE